MTAKKQDWERKCSCLFGKNGQRIGECLRCAEMEANAHIRGEKKIVRLLTRLYKKRGKPVWFLSSMDLEKLEKGEEYPT